MDPVDLDARRREKYERMLFAKTGLSALEVIALAIKAEENGADPHAVRRILDGDLSEVERYR